MNKETISRKNFLAGSDLNSIYNDLVKLSSKGVDDTEFSQVKNVIGKKENQIQSDINNNSYILSDVRNSLKEQVIYFFTSIQILLTNLLLNCLYGDS